jgi:prepilin-type N-terminal cleavage/methylation domain-containing protein
MKKTDKRRKGFTLIELIVVIAILAILAAIAVPNFIGLTKKANTATEVASAAEYATALNIYNTLNISAPITATPALDTDIPAFEALLTGAGVAVTTDIADDMLLSNVFARLTYTTDEIWIVSNKADI